MTASDDRQEDEGVPMHVATDAGFILKRERQQMGIIGSLIGNKDHAPTSVAALISVLILFIMAGLAIWGGPEKTDHVKLFGSILLAALGYLFGTLSGGRR